jgi:hypothetical protein
MTVDAGYLVQCYEIRWSHGATGICRRMVSRAERSD